MAEWFKAHAWKVCIGFSLSWVRIPLSPPKIDQKLHFFDQKLIIKKNIKKHQKCIDLYSLFTIKDFLDFIKKLKNVIIILS